MERTGHLGDEVKFSASLQHCMVNGGKGWCIWCGMRSDSDKTDDGGDRYRDSPRHLPPPSLLCSSAALEIPFNYFLTLKVGRVREVEDEQ